MVMKVTYFQETNCLGKLLHKSFSKEAHIYSHSYMDRTPDLLVTVSLQTIS